MRTNTILTTAAAISLLIMTLTSLPADTNSAAQDANFIKKAADANRTEIRLAKIALQNAQAQDVKNFAERMIKDHGNAKDELKPIAQEMNVTIPARVNEEHQQTIDRLSKLKGKEFDDAYTKAMVDDHTKVVGMFEKAEKNVQNGDLKKFADKTLPTLKEHLELARQL